MTDTYKQKEKNKVDKDIGKRQTGKKDLWTDLYKFEVFVSKRRVFVRYRTN